MLDKLVQLVVDFAYLFRFVVVVHPYEQAVILRVGRFRKVVSQGWHFVLPFKLDEILTETVTPRTTNLPVQTVTTSDGVTVSVAALVTWEVADVAKLLLEAAEHQEAMLDTATGILATSVMRTEWSELSEDKFTQRVKLAVRRKAVKWGIRVLDVQLTDLARTKTFRVLGLSGAAGVHVS